ncbi:hypothetical protein WJX77_002477 [Trebouxia sp. C0004]
MNDVLPLLPQQMKKPVTAAEPHSPQIKVMDRMGETEYATERDASRSTQRTSQEEPTPVAHMPLESACILSTNQVTYDSKCHVHKEGLSESSIVNQSFFLPLLPGPCASGQEAHVRMVYIPKVPPAMPTLASSFPNTDPSQLCSPDSCLKFGSFDAAHFSRAFSCAASAMHHPAPATQSSSQQLQEWQTVCRNNQERYPDPYVLFPMDVYNRNSFWPYPG